jgi:hypothetical protein
VAEKWVDAALSDTEMCGRAQIARDQLEEELSRTAFEIDVVEQKRLIAYGRERRGETSDSFAAEEDLTREARDSTLSDVLLDAYTTLSVVPLEVFGVGDRGWRPGLATGVGDRAAEERTRYVMMGALMVAVDAAVGKQEREKASA